MTARILIIEDTKTSMELLVLLLNAYAYPVIQADDGEQGLAIAMREKPDLILCDIHLPKLDGYAVLAALKSDVLLQTIPIVAVTALAMAGDCERLLAVGFDGYISKPIDPENFIAQIEKFLPADKLSQGRDQQAAAVTSGAHALQAIPVQQGHMKILVVDDNAVNRDLLRLTLEPSGYDITIATNMREGLACAHNAAYNLIISDLHMPGEDGFVFIEAIKQDPMLQHIPFMFISSTSDNDWDFRRAKEAGALCFIRRPVEPHILLDTISDCLKSLQDKNGNESGRCDGNHSDS